MTPEKGPLPSASGLFNLRPQPPPLFPILPRLYLSEVETPVLTDSRVFDSSSFDVISVNGPNAFSQRRVHRLLSNASGFTRSGRAELSSKTSNNINGHTSYHDGKYYETCSNCLLSEDTTLLPDGKSKGRYFFLFTRTGALEASELETFKNQAECLKFPSEYHFTSKDLCPDDRATASTAVKNTEKEQPEIEPNVQ
ncbi:unnamed protein product [Oreochromis niloticus]|nr:unnamed protein product [Mustela putorius furo]